MTMTITNEQIEQLKAEAASAGDIDQVMLCDLDLHGAGYVNDEYSVAQDVFRITRSQERARELCAKAIAEAQGQEVV